MMKHKITVTINWDAINKDINDKAFRMIKLQKLSAPKDGDVIEGELSLTDDDMAMLRRAMSQALAEVVNICKSYVLSTDHTSNNYNIAAGNITLTLVMPLSWNLAGCYSLGQMMHSYIVSKALCEWFRYTAPDRMKEQAELYMSASKEIKDIINARTRPIAGGQQLDLIVGESTTDEPCIKPPVDFEE